MWGSCLLYGDPVMWRSFYVGILLCGDHVTSYEPVFVGILLCGDPVMWGSCYVGIRLCGDPIMWGS